MTQLQKTIKYGAIVFGTYLSIMIIGIIILILTAIFGISTGIEEWENERKEDIELQEEIEEWNNEIQENIEFHDIIEGYEKM